MIRSKTIGLLVLVLGIWGTIAGKIIISMGSDDKSMEPIKVTNAVLMQKDSFPLALDYRDPFRINRRPDENALLKEGRPRAEMARRSVAIPTIEELQQWPNVDFVGAIFNTSRGRALATVRINGTEHIIEEGQRVGDVKVEKIARDSIQLFFRSQHKYIPRKK